MAGRMRYEAVTGVRVREFPTEEGAQAEALAAAAGGNVWVHRETRGDGDWMVYAGGVDPQDLEDDDWEEVDESVYEHSFCEVCDGCAIATFATQIMEPTCSNCGRTYQRVVCDACAGVVRSTPQTAICEDCRRDAAMAADDR